MAYLKQTDGHPNIESLRLHYEHGHLDETFLCLIFDYLQSYAPVELAVTMKSYVDTFLHLNSSSFNLIDSPTGNGRTLIDRLRTSHCHKALKTIKNHLRAIKKESDALLDLKPWSLTLTCAVCMEREANAMLLTCRHAGLCITCLKIMKSCPACRVSFEKKDIMSLYYL